MSDLTDDLMNVPCVTIIDCNSLLIKSKLLLVFETALVDTIVESILQFDPPKTERKKINFPRNANAEPWEKKNRTLYMNHTSSTLRNRQYPQSLS
jgi:hypothetical protein